MNNPKRSIKPHKGGRTIKLSTDATPETKAILSILWAKHGISLGDLVEEAAKAKAKKLNLKVG